MVEIREIAEGQTLQITDAMLLLRPRWKTAERITDFIDNTLRPRGYRIVGAFEHASDSASSVGGFRELWSTAWGHYLYVDDVSTVRAARARGYADLLMHWLVAEARRSNCEAVHLDSGVGSDRAQAHRLYMRHHLQISAHHFSLDL
jgi:GNAT superfamily N-acetyltransferase